MNFLILAAGTRNKIVQYFKRAFEGVGDVIATDASEFAPAIYEADRHYKVPHISAPGYIDHIIGICKVEQVSGVLTLIDPELSLLAANIGAFDQVGVTVIGSSYELCERAFDKMQMFLWLQEHGYNCAKSYCTVDSFEKALERGEISFPVFVKPIRGSASIAISKADDLETVRFLFSKSDGLMVQEFLRGREIGADVYIDMISKEVVSIFTKEKLLMRAGETDKAVSFKDEKLFGLIERFVTESGWTGQIDIDLFDIDGKYYISEVNPRFGGGYPHAYECGCDHMEMIKNNLAGKVNRRMIGNYDGGVYMMKYSDVAFLKR